MSFVNDETLGHRWVRDYPEVAWIIFENKDRKNTLRKIEELYPYAVPDDAENLSDEFWGGAKKEGLRVQYVDDEDWPFGN